MTVLHVVAGLDRDGGGLSELVPGFCRGLVAAGCRVHLASTDGPLGESVHAAKRSGVRVHLYARTTGHAVCYSNAMRRDLGERVGACDLVHVHSNWTFPVWWACREAVRHRRPLVMSPQGCLAAERLRRSRWKKRAAAGLFDRRYLRAAACLHATCAGELREIRNYGLPNPVAVIANGIDTDAFAGTGSPGNFRRRFPAGPDRRLLLFLARLDPLKGLDMLAQAWGRVALGFPDWHLVIVGPDERGYETRVRQAVRDAGAADRTTFCGPLYGQARHDALRAAELFVLPSRHENFGIAVAEAAYVGLPVITTQETPWSGLVERGAGWCVPATADAIAQALAEALAKPRDTLRQMGGVGREWVSREFTWPELGRQMREVYEWILGGGTPPACVNRTGVDARGTGAPAPGAA